MKINKTLSLDQDLVEALSEQTDNFSAFIDYLMRQHLEKQGKSRDELADQKARIEAALRDIDEKRLKEEELKVQLDEQKEKERLKRIEKLRESLAKQGVYPNDKTD